MIMKKTTYNILRWAAVIACIMVSMILLFAEPVTESNYTEWMLVFVCMKAAGVIVGAVAVGIAGHLTNVVKTIKGEENER